MQGTRVRYASNGYVTTATLTLPNWPMLTFATKKLSTGANGQKEDSASESFFCPRSFESFHRAVMVQVSMPGPGPALKRCRLRLSHDFAMIDIPVELKYSLVLSYYHIVLDTS